MRWNDGRNIEEQRKTWLGANNLKGKKKESAKFVYKQDKPTNK